jgi:hypothetical protein
MTAAWVAADLLAQAEHAPDAGSFMVTTPDFAVQSVGVGSNCAYSPAILRQSPVRKGDFVGMMDKRVNL